MAAIIYGKVPFGTAQILPLAAFPKGRTRIRIRQDEFVQVFVKTETGIEVYYPEEMNGVWIPKYKKGENKTA